MRTFFCIIIALITFNLYAELSFQEIQKCYYNSYESEQSEKYQNAIKDLEPVYTNYPNTYTVNYRLGWLYYLNKNYSNAIMHLEKALTQQPNSIEVMNTIIYVYSATSEWEKLEETANNLLKIDYYNYTANYWYSVALRNLGKYSAGIKIDRKMLTIFPSDPTFLFELALNLYFNKDYDESETIFESVVILNPNNKTAPEYLKKLNK